MQILRAAIMARTRAMFEKEKRRNPSAALVPFQDDLPSCARRRPAKPKRSPDAVASGSVAKPQKKKGKGKKGEGRKKASEKAISQLERTVEVRNSPYNCGILLTFNRKRPLVARYVKVMTKSEQKCYRVLKSKMQGI